MNLQQALQQRGIPLRNSRNSGEISICCPFCPQRGESVDTRFRLGVNIYKNIAHCYNCGWKSRSAGGRILKALRLPVVPLDGVIEEKTAALAEVPQLPEGYHLLCSTDSFDRFAERYLRKRGITSKQIARNQIGVTFLGRYAYRVIFPVYEGKTLRGIVARALYATMTPRYLNSTGDKYLYNFRPCPTIVLLEGVFKCLRVEQLLRRVGVNARACALLGHDITEVQLQQLRSAKVDRIILWPDPDPVGRRGMLKVAEKLFALALTLDIRIEVVFSQEAADEAPQEMLEECWLRRVPFTGCVTQKLGAMSLK